MDAASGGMSARGGDESPSFARGVVVGPLTEAHPDRIVLGDRIVFLRDGMTCTYPPGTPLEVVYTEQDGRSCADKITPLRPGN